MRSPIILLFGLALLAAPALAGDDGINRQKALELFDHNQDGRLSQEELSDPRSFDKLDANGDGVVDRKEFDILFNDKQAAEERFKQLDADDNLRFEKSEFMSPLLSISF